jgi:hypothetical protein
VPYLKFSRDKRGYEYFSIVEPGVPRRGRPPRPRVLFWFRTPPQVKVGRHPFTDEIRREIEERNPAVRFDWPRLLATPIPPPEADHWRERRRAEKAAKQAAREAEQAEIAEQAELTEPAETVDQAELAAAAEVPAEAPANAVPVLVGQEPAGQEDEGADADLEGEPEEEDDIAEMADAQTADASAASDPAAASVDAAAPPAGGRRRKRRRRRRRKPAADPSSSPPDGPATPTEEV